MDVACSTLCFTKEPLEGALRHIADMEFSKIDLAVTAGGPHVSIRDVMDDPASVLQRIRRGPTIGVAAITARLSSPADVFREQLDAIARFAKQLAAPILVIDAAPTGTPFEAEVERLSDLERMTSLHGAILTVTTRSGTLTEDPATAVKLCEAVSGLALTLDPSHYVCGPNQGKPFDVVFPVVRHVHLRDTGRRMDQLQVKVGRGEIEYGKIVTSLSRFQFKGSLVVDIEDQAESDMDVEAEIRKLRLLLESLI